MAEAEAEAEMQGKSRCDAEPPLPFTLSHSCECAHSLWHVFSGFCPGAACFCCCCCCCIFAWPTSTAGQQRVPAEQQLFGQAEELNERMRNAKCVGDDSFSWVIASARLCDACRLLVFLLLLLRVCVCVCMYCCYRLIY